MIAKLGAGGRAVAHPAKRPTVMATPTERRSKSNVIVMICDSCFVFRLLQSLLLPPTTHYGRQILRASPECAMKPT
jgi:hypothetical protein